jgi:hypothetical protein
MNKMLKILIIYVAVAVFAVIFTNVYAMFGHGVRSNYMDLMFIVPLSAATPFLLMFILRSKIHEKSGYRLFSHVYGSGVALLTIGLASLGVLAIAGGSSSYAPWFVYVGSGMTGLGLVILIAVAVKARKNS